MLIGRETESAALEKLLTDARLGISGALTLRGEGGSGKTAILNDAALSANGALLIRLNGIESESDWGYAALHRMMRPYLERSEALPEVHKDAIQSAFGLRDSHGADRFMVGMAVLSILGDLAVDQPVFVFVDDAHWIDRDSLSALEFVARRLQADKIAIVFAGLEDRDGSLAFDGIPQIALPGLNDASARRLIALQIETSVSFPVATAMIAATHGNPLALIELSSELTPDQMAGRDALPEPLPLGSETEKQLLARVQLLATDTQELLLLIATDQLADRREVLKAALFLGISSGAADAAERDGLLKMHPKVELTPIQLRSALYRAASPIARRKVHLAMVEAIDKTANGDRRVMHLAAAASEPEEAIALELELAAIQARTRGGYAAEASLLVRSSELTPDPTKRARRLLAGARAALLAGSTDYAETLLGQAASLITDPIGLAEVKHLEGAMHSARGNAGLAPRLLLASALMFEPADPRRARSALLDALASFLVSGHRTVETSGQDLASAGERLLANSAVPPAESDVLLSMLTQFIKRGYVASIPALRQTVTSFTSSTLTQQDLNQWFPVGMMVALELWDEGGWHSILLALEKASRQQGAPFALQQVLVGLASYETRAGRFTAAERRLAEVNELSSAIDNLPTLYSALNVELLAWQGEPERVRVAINILDRERNCLIGQGTLECMSLLAQAVLDLGLGLYPQALSAALPVSQSEMAGWACQALPTVIEAAVRTGESDQAQGALEQLTERAEATTTPWALGVLYRSRALVASGPEVEEMFENAIIQLNATSFLTEIARTYLLLGEWLRRQKRRLDAQTPLRVSYDMFTEMGATAFAERARVELMATGERTRSRGSRTGVQLTDRESQIAHLAANRATSREIAEQLYISANTVEYHLRKVFQKLGINSRRDLSGRLQEEGLD